MHAKVVKKNNNDKDRPTVSVSHGLHDTIVVQTCCCIRSPQPVAMIDYCAVYSMHNSCCSNRFCHGCQNEERWHRQCTGSLQVC